MTISDGGRGGPGGWLRAGVAGRIPGGTADWVRGGVAGRIPGGVAGRIPGGTADWVRGGATALAAARTAIGVVALAAPTLVTRPWLGPDRGPAVRVLGRALGGRDLALGLGALAALQQQPPAGSRPAGRPGIWIGVGALSDAMDVLATVAAWDELPPLGRWLVAMSAGGAAVAGAAAAGLLLTAAAGSPGTESAGSPTPESAGSPGAAAAGSPGTESAGSPGTESAGSPTPESAGSPGAAAAADDA